MIVTLTRTAAYHHIIRKIQTWKVEGYSIIRLALNGAVVCNVCVVSSLPEDIASIYKTSDIGYITCAFPDSSYWNV